MMSEDATSEGAAAPARDEATSADDELVDAPLQEEIELVGTLVAAVSPRDHALSDAEIDRLLGVTPRTDCGCACDAGRTADRSRTTSEGTTGQGADPDQP